MCQMRKIDKENVRKICQIYIRKLYKIAVNVCEFYSFIYAVDASVCVYVCLFNMLWSFFHLKQKNKK